MLTEEQRDDYMSLNLWDQKEFQNYIEEQNRIKEEKMGSSAKYKQYKRYLKNKKF